ncbi:MAG: adenylate/guanylate cyclase domain-containing protein [Solirubrobacterales bacterium]
MNWLKRLFAPAATISGRVLVARTVAWLAISIIGANIFGVAALYAEIAWLLPEPQIDDSSRVRTVNVIVLAVYLAVIIPTGAIWMARIFSPLRRWLIADRAPTDAEQRRALRAPWLHLRPLIFGWTIGTIMFVTLNSFYSLRLALVVAIATILTAVATCAFSYLAVERSTREVVRRALAYGVPEKPAIPGMTTRVMLTWAFSTGAPILGLALLGGAVVLDILPPDQDQLAFSAMFLSGVALFVGFQAMLLVTRSIADPVNSVRKALRRVSDGDLETIVAVNDGSEVGLLQAGFNDMAAGLRERERLRDIFGRHVGEDVASLALEQGTELGGEVRDVAALFIDLVGSTELAEAMPPQDVVELLNRFFEVVVSTVAEHGGSVNKFEGDAALCVFGAPVEHDSCAADALAAARELRAGLAAAVPELDFGIGVSAGPVVAGNIGAAARFEYTVIGDPVNEAARLTDLAKQQDGRVIASERALLAAGDAREADHWRLGESLVLRGRSQATRVATPVTI